MIMGFVIGLLAGVLGVLFAQYTFKESNEDQVVSTVQKSPNGITNSGPSTTTSRLSIANSSPRKDSSSIKSDKDEKDDDKEKGKEIWETIMALGEDKQKEEVSDEVDKMAERFNLTASQKSRLQELLEAKAKTQSEAGLKLFTGKASIADLIASDEDNYSEIDKAMQELLSGDQLAEYESYTEEREIERIEKKTNEDLGGLREIAGITEEQIDQARDFFIEINASEKPGSMDMTNITRDQFMGVIDDALDKRISGVAEFLNDDQVTSYRKQVDGFRKMISAFVPDTEE
jgi:hypothetical protein